MMALAGGMELADTRPCKDCELVVADDDVATDRTGTAEPAGRRVRRGRLSLRRSALTRKIVTFNLIALNVLVIGILYLNNTQDMLVRQHVESLRERTALTAGLVSARLPRTAPGDLATGDGIDAVLGRLALRPGTTAYLFDRTGRLRGKTAGGDAARAVAQDRPPAPLADALGRLPGQLWRTISAAFGAQHAVGPAQHGMAQIRSLVEASVSGGAQVRASRTGGATLLRAAAPVMQGAVPLGAVVLVDSSGDVDRIVAVGRARVLQMFLIATLVSIGLSLVLASTISNPLAQLATAAEIGRERNRARRGDGRIRIPDLTARPDEIGQLSGALRGMVGALHDRIKSNEQFAADVAHEIKNPLASLRSAVGTLRITGRADQRDRLLDLVEHDVRRLDRLVSDISNASRLDSELVREAQDGVDLVTLLRQLTQYLSEEAGRKGVELTTDFPREPVAVTGLEARLAQVFVNLITNAISFCAAGDAIRVWVRRRANRVLVVVEDTGPGIPEDALEKIFQRFYSQRSAGEFGNNSGLGLAISKQIVEAHDGVIWAENIGPTHADATSEPLGARFVVGLPV